MKFFLTFSIGVVSIAAIVGAILTAQHNIALKQHVIPEMCRAQIKLGYALASAGINNTNIVEISDAYTSYMLTNGSLNSSFISAHWSLYKNTNNVIGLYFNYESTK